MKTQMIDVKHDYMELIYKEVVKFNEAQKDIQIRDDFKEYLKTRDGNINNVEVEIFDWMTDYSFSMTEEKKNKLYNKYGQVKLFSQLPDIALSNHYTFEGFMNQEEDEILEMSIIRYIIENDVIKDMIVD